MLIFMAYDEAKLDVNIYYSNFLGVVNTFNGIPIDMRKYKEQLFIMVISMGQWNYVHALKEMWPENLNNMQCLYFIHSYAKINLACKRAKM